MDEGLYMGCGQVWYWDHKTWSHWNGGLTEEAFCARARAFVEDPHQCFVHYEVNCRLLDFIAASPHLPPCLLLLVVLDHNVRCRCVAVPFLPSSAPARTSSVSGWYVPQTKPPNREARSRSLFSPPSPLRADPRHGCWLCVMEERLETLLRDLELVPWSALWYARSRLRGPCGY